ncbi:RNA-directed RNA polymerase [Tieghemostelium lacteum]|uniref:RNA-directed RNA polymerase n=1 Tax=Tieghemostelium lacteum TaxID=361077 RepID=A0A151ZCZ7_TIELA|nr:RNA-directed RNA polymerase [Tieghemostelium lacteum]|eukprot:KYQ91823.1 RNA-directed RNA polymerase [Tieghemostelium lacteum]
MTDVKFYQDTRTPGANDEVPKVSVEPYEYQIESYKHCVSNNTLLVLSTGMGKTLISILTLIQFRKYNGLYNDNDDKNEKKYQKRVGLFLVDRIPLVVQQAEAIETIGKPYGLKTCSCYGEINIDSKREEIVKKDYDVLVATAQTVVNLLANKKLQIEDFYIVVFDEVHHAVDDHPFVKIMQFVEKLDYNFRPRILGMSASLCSENTVQLNIDRIRKIENRMNSSVFRPTLLVGGDNFTVKHEIKSFKTSSQEQTFQYQVNNYFSVLVKQFLDMVNGYSDIDLDDINNHNRYLFGLRKLKKYLLKTINNEKKELYMRIFDLIMDVYEIFNVLFVEGVQKAVIQLYNILIESSLIEIYYILQKELHFNTTEDPHLAKNSSRFNAFLEVFNGFLHEFKTKNVMERFRSIVFVQTRFCSERLLSLVKNNPTLSAFNPHLFVGHGGEGGMETKEQQDTIQKFKNGDIKLLIATNVLEEGLDIKDCNLVISYDGISSLKSLIQRRGRARSHVHSKFIILANERESVDTANILNLETVMVNSIIHVMKKRQIEKENLALMVNWKELIGYTSDPSIFYLSFFHLKDSDVEDIESIIYAMSSYSTVTIQKTVTPGQDEPFLKYCHVFAIKYIGDEDLDEEQMIKEVLREVTRYNWWVRVPSHLVSQAKLKSPNTSETSLSLKSNSNMTTTKNGMRIYGLKFHCILAKWQFGNFYEPTVFVSNNSLNSDLHNELRFYICKRELQVHYRNYIFFMSYDDLHPYCVINQNDTDRIKIFEFYLFLHRPGKITRQKDPQKPPTIRSVPPVNMSYYGDSFAYKFTLVNYGLDEQKYASTIKEIKSKLVKYGFELFYGNIQQSTIEPPKLDFSGIKHRDALYLFKCLETQKSFGRPIYFQNFVGKIQQMLKDRKDTQVEFILQEALNTKTLFYDLYKLFEEKEEELKLNTISKYPQKPNYILTRVVVVTPSRMIFKQPTFTQSNRVLRSFDPTRFLLFHFQDEQFKKVAYLGDDVKNYLEKIITETGITVCGDTYKFLGGSNSLMKNVGAWLYNEKDTTRITSIAGIREWMGDIPKHPRKFLRSQAILFSSTTPTGQVIPASYLIEEIKDSNTRPEFTEGCGTIGRELAQTINSNFGYPPNTCSYQIRFGGYKGVVSIDPKPERNNALFLRASMKKFDTSAHKSEHRTLEIISISTARTCNLSKPLISLLSGIGTPDSYFLDLFHETLTKMTLPLNDTKVALKQLSEYFPELTEYELVNDNYLRRIQSLLYKLNLGNLQSRFNMELKDSRNLLGIADETETLPPGTVFIQITEKQPGEDRIIKKVITGIVGVTRNPATHPGDIRFLKAVQNKKLEELYMDVIVFSVQGKIPSFKQSSGGDLDGDRYFVFYDQKLLESCKEHEPSTNDDPEIPIEPHYIDICSSNILGKQFCSNLTKGFIGDLSNALLAAWDFYGVEHHYCNLLSKQCFIEVDFPKHGINGQVPTVVANQLKTRGYPHFMKKGSETKTYYQSDKVLGVMYDQCSQLSWIGDQIPEIEINKDLIIVGHEKYLKDAKVQYSIYKSRVGNLLHRSNAKSEEELTIGFFENPLVNLTHTSDAKKDIIHQFENIRKECSQIFLLEFNENEGSEELTLAKHHKEIEQKISAWYSVAYSDKDDKRTLSFYWNVKNYQKKKDNSQELSKWKHLLTSSIIDLYKSNLKKLEPIYKTRLLIIEEIKRHIQSQPFFNNVEFQLQMTGSTPLLLFDPESKSDLKLCILDSDNSAFISKNKNQLINQLHHSLMGFMEEIRTKENVILGKYKSTKISISTNIDSLKTTVMHQNYMIKYPFLMVFLSLILNWGRDSYLVYSHCKHLQFERQQKIKKRTKSDSLTYLESDHLISLTMKYCIDKGLIKELLIPKETMTNKPWIHFENLSQQCLESDYFNIDNQDLSESDLLGSKLLEFFNFYNKHLLDVLWKKNQNSPNNFAEFVQTENRASYLFFQETFLVAYHSLSHSKDYRKFLENCTSMKSTHIKIRLKTKFLERYDLIKRELDNILHFTHEVMPSLTKPNTIVLKGSQRSISEASDIIRNILNK